MNSYKIIAILQLITGIGIIAFWVVFLNTNVLYPENMPECYLNHELSFPIADIILCVGLIFSSILLLKQNKIGFKLSLICAGAMVFLGILDITYNLQNGIYFISIMDGLLSGFINLWLVLFGLFIIIKVK